MTYDEALSFIHSATRFGARSGLHRISKLMNRLSNPQAELKIIHVAGTNGKGSTCAMTASVLQRAGYKTGLYISPFVIDFRERIQVNGAMISGDRLAEIIARIAPHVEEMKKADMEPTEFEIVTAAAFVYFREEHCDFVVLEVGLGGRFDATNVVSAPLCAAICSISLDHTQYLGDTTGKIAFEKCGILKEGSRAVLYCDLPEDALQVCRDICVSRGIAPNIPDFCAVTETKCNSLGSEFVYKGQKYEIGMTGSHQIKNALTAIGIFEELRKIGTAIDRSTIVSGLAQARFGGRMELVRQTPMCIIDGAHNRDAIDNLRQNLLELFPNRKIIIVMGMVRDKEHSDCIRRMAEICGEFIATEPQNPRALSASECALEAGSKYAFKNPEEAAETALDLAGENDVIVACGSLYLIGQIKKVFER